MDTLREVVFDMEWNGDQADKIYCLCYRFVNKPDEVTTLTEYSHIERFFENSITFNYLLIGHYIIGADLPVVRNVLGVTKWGKLVDTLPLSWYLNHDRILHGLESYGEDYGYPKPVIDDWETQTIEDYTNRCEVDTMINLKLWLELKGKLQVLYD